MTNKTRLIQVELNEITKSIIDQLIEENELPNFKKICKEWAYVETHTADNYCEIEPWIQWVTAHTGKEYDEHKIFRLGDGGKLNQPQIWEELSKCGRESAIIGSMNTRRGNCSGGVYFPDPWALDGETYPANLQPLWDLVSAKVQTHATKKLSLGDLFQGFKTCFSYKIPFSIYNKIIVQLILQKIKPRKKWRMAGVFDALLYELFKSILRSTQCSFYTLFLNSCAHYQHHFWRKFQPELFEDSIKCPDCDENDDPIRYGYKLYDQMLGSIADLAKEPNTVVVITSAFSQEPFLSKEGEGGMNYYRLYSHQEFLEKIGINNARAFPLMSRDWQVQCESTQQAENVKKILKSLTVSGEKLFSLKSNGPLSFFVETAVTRGHINDKTISISKELTLPGVFSDYFCSIAVKSGHHISQGVMWVSDKEAIENTIANEGRMPVRKMYELNKEIICS